MRWRRQHVNQRVTGRAQPRVLAGAVAIAGAHLEDHTAAADRGNIVTHGAAGAVERRTETFFRRLDFGEVLEAQTKLAELGRREPGERGARTHGVLAEDI